MFGHLLCILSIKGATEGKQPTLLSTEVCHDTLLQHLMELNHIMSVHMGLHMDYSNMCSGFKLSIYGLVSLWDVLLA